LGDRWVAINLTLAIAADHGKRLRELRQEAGLSMEGFRSILMAVNFPIEPNDLARYLGAGIGHGVLPPMKDGVVLGSAEDLDALVEELGESFVGAARKL